jgi:pimeloyl-ACP methyl ester carboxylesterase
VLPALERRHDVLAPTLPGHAGGPRLEEPVTVHTLADAIERVMDEAGFDSAHLAGNSLGGHVALHLAARGRARTVVAFAPAGGWARDDEARGELLAWQRTLHEAMRRAAPFADVPVSPGAEALIDAALRDDWDLDAERIECPVRIVWGTEDRLLRWPSAAVRYRTEWLPHADWVELDGAGHHPQLDVPVEAAQLILGYSSPS